MEDLAGTMQYRIACLETNLSTERQRNTQLERTIIQLSTLLAQQFVLPATVKQVSAAFVPTIEQGGKKSEAKVDNFNTGLKQAPNLIDVDINDIPPKLDLEFKGLRTAHDGPLKDPVSGTFTRVSKPFNPAAEPFKPASKPLKPSLKQALAQPNPAPIPSDSQPSPCSPVSETLVGSPEQETGTNVAKKGTKIGGTPDAVVKNVNDSIVNFSFSNSYRSITPAHQSFGSNSTQDSDYPRKPLFLLYGIRYKPREDDLFHNESRVMIFDIPSDLTMEDVLRKIRGGLIVSCQLLNTRFTYNTSSMMIRFPSYVEAKRCVEYAANNPIILDGKTLSVQLIPTPSYPLGSEVYRNIFERGHTRCLRIYQYKQRVPAYIREQYNNDRYIEHQRKNGCGDWFVRFTSVQRASALWAELEVLRIPKAGEFCFMNDPCDLEDSSEVMDGRETKVKSISTGELKWWE